jgi:hypothetical protein
MKAISHPQGADSVRELLRHAQLDSIRVHSIVLELGFFVNRADDPLMWVVVTGDFKVTTDSSYDSSVDFFERRGHAIRAAYGYMGDEVREINIGSNLLEIAFDNGSFLIFPDEGDSPEESWAVTTGSPDVHLSHRWLIAPDETGAIRLQSPED